MSQPDKIPNQALLHATQAYERARQGFATRQVWWLLLLCAPMLAVHPHLALAAFQTLLLLVLGYYAFFKGQAWQHGFASGLLAGTFPLVLAALARPLGHGCEVAGECYSWCMPACAVGAIMSAALVGSRAKATKDLKAFAVSSSISTLAFGSLGCACFNGSGAVALVVVFSLLATPTFVVMARAN